MKHTLWALAVLITLGMQGLLAKEQEPMPPQAGMHGQAWLMGQLKLNDDQKKEVEKLRFDLAKQMISQRAKVANAQLEYRELLKADNLDRATIEKKSTEIADLRSQSRSMLLNHWFAVNKLLNPDQQKVWKKVLERGSQLAMRAGRGRGMMHGPQRFRQGRAFHRDGGPDGPAEKKVEE